MRELRLVAVSEDGTRLILRTDGEESSMALPVDERLHAAIRGDRARLGQLEIQMDSQLRPRDIQARVRSGESVESVAAAAGVPLDRVMRYAGPVLAEREHVAGRARRATVRRIGGDGQPPALEDAVAQWVSRSSVDPDTVEWDAWRRDDGRWQVSAAWQQGSDSTSARFAFDPAGRSVAPDDDEARAIAGERPPEPVVQTGTTRLSVVAGAATGEPLDDDDLANIAPPAITVVEAEDPDHDELDADDQPTAPVPVTARRGRRDLGARNGRGERRRNGSRADEPGADLWSSPAAPVDTDTSSDRLRLSDIASRVEVEGDEPSGKPAGAEDDAADAVPVRRAAGSARARRPSVPSWDEIMFGRRRKPD
jgi:Protein of unknown function (DUF3071)